MSSFGETAPSQPRISLVANQAVSGILFGLAIITYAVRSYIRFFVQKQFHVEDGILLFAVLCLIATSGLHFAALPYQYNSLSLILNAEITLALELLPQLPKISRLSNTAATLWWFVIVPVKLAFLFFFRRLISRVRDLNIFWWVAVIITTASGPVCIAASWLTCPYFTSTEILRCSGPVADARVIRDTAITTAMDITTDILVISIPILLLWRVRISRRQKLGLGVSLCLSLVMVVVAVTRMAGIRLPVTRAVDIVWLAFWQQQECSIAVIMISVSAFRGLFTGKPSKVDSPVPRTSWSWRRKAGKKMSTSTATETTARSDKTGGSGAERLPQIPSATLTGMRTTIENVRGSTLWTTDDDPEGLVFGPRLSQREAEERQERERFLEARQI